MPDEYTKKQAPDQREEKLPELKSAGEDRQSQEQLERSVQLHTAEESFDEQLESSPHVTNAPTPTAVEEEAHVQLQKQEQQENTNLFYLPGLAHIAGNWGVAGGVKIFFALLPVYVFFTSVPFVPDQIRELVDFHLEPLLWGALIFGAHLQLAWSYALYQVCKMANISQGPKADSSSFAPGIGVCTIANITKSSKADSSSFAPGMAGLFGLLLGPLTAPVLVLLLSWSTHPVFEHSTGTIACDLISRSSLLVIGLLFPLSFGPFFLAALAYLRYFRFLETATKTTRQEATPAIFAAMHTAAGLMLPPVLCLWFIEANLFQWPYYGLVYLFQLAGFMAAFAALKGYADSLYGFLKTRRPGIVEVPPEHGDTSRPERMCGVGFEVDRSVRTGHELVSRLARVNIFKLCGTGFAIALLIATTFGRTQLYLADSSIVSGSQKDSLFDAAIAADPDWSRPYLHKAKWLKSQGRQEEALLLVNKALTLVKSEKGLERLRQLQDRLKK